MSTGNEQNQAQELFKKTLETINNFKDVENTVLPSMGFGAQQTKERS